VYCHLEETRRCANFVQFLMRCLPHALHASTQQKKKMFPPKGCHNQMIISCALGKMPCGTTSASGGSMFILTFWGSEHLANQGPLEEQKSSPCSNTVPSSVAQNVHLLHVDSILTKTRTSGSSRSPPNPPAGYQTGLTFGKTNAKVPQYWV
jgi:hypothetical protein